MANKTRSNSARGKGRDKDLEAFDDGKVDKDAAKAEAIEAIISNIIDITDNKIQRGFFIKMIDEIKNGEIKNFELDNFYFLNKFMGNEKAKSEALKAFCEYFFSLCMLSKKEELNKFSIVQDFIFTREKIIEALNTIEILAISDTERCHSIRDVESLKSKYKNTQKPKNWVATITGAEASAYFYGLKYTVLSFLDLKERNISKLALNNPVEQEKQKEKDNFRDRLKLLDRIFETKAIKDIRDTTLIQNICDYVFKNFNAFFDDIQPKEEAETT